MAVNERIAEPEAPGTWVDDKECICGDRYSDFKVGASFRNGVQTVRMANKNNEGEGFKSRGPVLWAMRVEKLTEWYMHHSGCKGLQVD